MNTAEVTKHGLASMQVCVPYDWTDEQVEEFANLEIPTGISSRWSIRKDGDPALNGDAERVSCAQREMHVHVMLDC